MKFMAVRCDCCGKIMEEKEAKKFNAKLDMLTYEKDLCASCSDKLSAILNPYFKADNTAKSSAAIIKQYSAPTSGKSASSNGRTRVVDGSAEKGPLTNEQKAMATRLYKEGLPMTEISEKVGRKISTVQKFIEKKVSEGSLKRPEAKEESKDTTPTQPTKVSAIESTEPAGEEQRKLDKGKILALANAGWSPMSIAYEVHATVDEVKEVISQHRKK